MTITFLSNYINHHQIPFCRALRKLLAEDFCFVQAMPMEQERIDMGWQVGKQDSSYVHLLYEEEEKCLKLVEECDILLAGWSEREDLVQKRLLAGKPVIRISERIYREGRWKAISPKGLIHKYKEHIRFRNDKAYLLCAGAYVAGDFDLIHAYPEKMYKWGYFPPTNKYTDEEWKNLKTEEGTLQFVWAGRFIPLKHPEYMVKLAHRLQQNSHLWKDNIFHDFHIHMVGSGEMEEGLRHMAKQLQVEGRMTFHGFMAPDAVRCMMEKSHIHLFTSNYLEGWGAVVNEAMNSGCVPVAGMQAGAVPYLISHRNNGMVYQGESFEKMAEAVEYLITHQEERKNMSRNAYETIVSLWNAEYAAAELVRFCRELLEGEPTPAKEGPLSIAPVRLPAKRRRDEDGR